MPLQADALVLSLVWTLATGHLDAAALRAYANNARVPAEVAWAIAEQESLHNTNPALRGHHCWNKQVRLRDCEVGRMQVKPSTARKACPGLDVFTYAGNVACSMRLLRQLYEARGSWELAIRAYQCPSCRQVTPYQQQVLVRLGRIELRLRELGEPPVRKAGL